ncbi:Maf family protein [Pseudosulfitobacter pseudonitzschiae]|uniref:Maf family protein n=1 Tax=Pseudosulfitobacter pseudonitzschiae TaxID=1402135 RepID=UPI001AFB530A|nr:nucleoside triphosphate pyrophosphatase [Pseudosulfitobacter pseudonitzschiae]MBM1815623.1 septum formation protein Maf [Pseudosulfitobacter pseudonitzschiae]MBM1832614.1 septum formation protein Maf [Pseudosulfitobacter pseudonitzschiae]MBM1837482.1 septum formation protein Maf [Pseudosulfitobacter pseudonitzschiae]MBM1842328.1 septum formation protein Maf [Pseudosulfitobacter pseudonitzschiae]MBM1847196.1 septum formation protein Maf [Pseudosulfitobacter pseudonitzschiae]
MPQSIILASGSSIRADMLTQAGVAFEVMKPRVDEESVKAGMLAEQAKPRDIADTLAEIKARKISDKMPGVFVLGCDQVLDHRGTLLSKPETPEDAVTQLTALRGDTHSLLSAAVICENGEPIWRHIGQVRVRMRDASDRYIQDYVDRNWDSIRHSVGGYKIEEEGVRLMASIEGDYFSVLGMPLLQLLAFLTVRGVVQA